MATIISGDCLSRLAELPVDSIDACVTDPPYGLEFMGKDWDHGVPGVAYWREVYRVLKPGAFLLAFGGTRTYHRLACAIEDAGFEIRDMVSWLYGSGFPKSLDISKAIDKAAGAEREIVGSRLKNTAIGGNDLMRENGKKTGAANFGVAAGDRRVEYGNVEIPITVPATDAARQWSGWGTALKPALEPICMARKPLSEDTVAANVLKWGTGAINVDGCRIASGESTTRHNHGGTGNPEQWRTGNGGDFVSGSDVGRFPANVIHDGSEEVLAGFPDARSAGNYPSESWGTGNGVTYRSKKPQGQLYSDSGSAARFFYQAKATKKERLGSKHPTVKPIALMRYLCRLVTPPGGVVLDPFAGTGTTGEAAILEGFRTILIEREPEYLADIERRLGETQEQCDLFIPQDDEPAKQEAFL